MSWEAFGAIGGSLLGGGLDLIGQSMANAENRRAAKEAREFVKWQMANRYQETRKDMEKAGLNPLLAFGGGAGAGGYGGSPLQAPARNLLEGLSESAKGMSEKLQKARLQESERELAYHAAGKMGADWQLSEDAAEKTRAETEKVDVDKRRSEAEARLLEAQIPAAEAQKKLFESEGGELFKQAITILNMITGRGGSSAR